MALLAGAAVSCSGTSARPPAAAAPATVPDRADVTVTGPVTEALASNVVLVGEPGPEVILVVIPDGQAPLRTGQYVEVTGEVVAFELDAMTDGPSGDRAGLGAWDGEPCLLASRIRTVAAR